MSLAELTQGDEEGDGSNFDLDPLLYQPRVMRTKMVPILIQVPLLYLPKVMRKPMVPILNLVPLLYLLKVMRKKMVPIFDPGYPGVPTHPV